MTNHHFIALVDFDAFPLDQLQVTQTRDDFMLHPKLDLHVVRATFFDNERFLSQGFNSTGSAEINNNTRTPFDKERELKDNNLYYTMRQSWEQSREGIFPIKYLARITRFTKGTSRCSTDTQRCLPAGERLISGIWIDG